MMKEATEVSEFAKKINIYDAILNTKLAWDAVTSTTIISCFKKAGISPGIGLGVRPLPDITEPEPDSDTDEDDDLPPHDGHTPKPICYNAIRI